MPRAKRIRTAKLISDPTNPPGNIYKAESAELNIGLFGLFGLV